MLDHAAASDQLIAYVPTASMESLALLPVLAMK
jgi:hypothetical protein